MNEVSYDFGQVKVLATDLHGPVLETSKRNYARLLPGSRRSMNFVRMRNGAVQDGLEKRPEVVVVTGSSDIVERSRLSYMRIRYCTTEHGLGILSPDYNVARPIYEFDGYEHTKDSVILLQEIGERFEVDKPLIAAKLRVHPDSLRSEPKRFMKNFIQYDPKISLQHLMQCMHEHVDGKYPVENIAFRISHGAVDVRLKDITKRDGLIVLAKHMDVQLWQIAGVEDSDWIWLDLPGYAFWVNKRGYVPDAIKQRIDCGTGELIKGDYKDEVISSIISKVKGA